MPDFELPAFEDPDQPDSASEPDERGFSNYLQVTGGVSETAGEQVLRSETDESEFGESDATVDAVAAAAEDAGADDRDLLGDGDEPYLPNIGRITVLGEEWEHGAITPTGEESSGGLGSGEDISRIEVTGDVTDDGRHARTGESRQGVGSGGVDTDGVLADMFGLDNLAPAQAELPADARQDDAVADHGSTESAEQDEARLDANDRRGHIEMQELHLRSVQQGISWELFSDGVLSRLGVNEHRYGAVEDVEGAAQLDRTFTPSLRPFRDGHSGEIHQRLSLAAVTEVEPSQGIRRTSYITVGSIDHLGMLHPMSGVSREDAQSVYEKAERLLTAKNDGLLPDLEDNLLGIRNPYTGIAEA